MKQRFVLATVKAAVLEYCKASAADVCKVLETQDPSEIFEDLKIEQAAAQESRAINNEQAFSKPRRPGRGKRRLNKKK